MSAIKKIAKSSLVVFIALVITLITVDIITYLVSPNQGISFIPAYKKNRFQEKLNDGHLYHEGNVFVGEFLAKTLKN